MNKQPVRDILDVRSHTHGDYVMQATAWRQLHDVCSSCPNWHEFTAPQHHAMIMLLTKFSRILTGNPDERDHWLDIAGYATLVADSLEPSPAPMPFPKKSSLELVNEAMLVATREHSDNVRRDLGTVPVESDNVDRLVPQRRGFTPHPPGPRHAMTPDAPENPSCPPWVIPGAYIDYMDAMNRWYKPVGNGLYMLESWVDRIGDDDQPPPSLTGFYAFAEFPDATGWLLEIVGCPPAERDRWPTYRHHVNAAEHKELLTWERGLYEWVESNSHFGLKDYLKAWHGRG